MEPQVSGESKAERLAIAAVAVNAWCFWPDDKVFQTLGNAWLVADRLPSTGGCVILNLPGNKDEAIVRAQFIAKVIVIAHVKYNVFLVWNTVFCWLPGPTEHCGGSMEKWLAAGTVRRDRRWIEDYIGCAVVSKWH